MHLSQAPAIGMIFVSLILFLQDSDFKITGKFLCNNNKFSKLFVYHFYRF